MIAACVVVQGYTLVTRNVDDFKRSHFGERGDRYELIPMPGRSISADRLSVQTQDLLRKCFAPTGCFISQKMRHIAGKKGRSLF